MFPVSPIVPARAAAAVLALAAVVAAPSARAVTPFVLKDIRVEGLQRTDPGTVFAALPFRIGDTYNGINLSHIIIVALKLSSVLRPIHFW